MEAMHLRPCGAPTGVENASCSGASRASAVPARCSYAASPRHRGPATIALSRRMRGSARGGGGLHVAAAAGGERRAGAIFVPRDSASADASASASDKRPASASKDVDALNGALQLSLAAITAPVAEDMKVMNQNLLSIVGSRSPLLMSAAEQIFGAGGKKLRPVLCFLVARATAAAQNLSELTPQHRKLAEITEMIHTASLVHDDVLDDCALRRGKSTVHTLYGTRVAVLVGDYLFAQSSWFLANLDNLEVIKLISQVIADFANGEISQAGALFNCDTTLEEYLDKSFYKTASLIAASCRSEAVFSGCEEELKRDMFEYGRHLGLAFQIVDDILDFTQSTEQLGKPQGQDLASGNLTAPAILALAAPGGSRLRELVESEFQETGALEEALGLVESLNGLDAARSLARAEGNAALASLQRLPHGEARTSLESMVEYVLQRVS